MQRFRALRKFSPKHSLNQAQHQPAPFAWIICFERFVSPHTWQCLALAFRSSMTPTGAQQPYCTVLACLSRRSDSNQLR